MHNVKAEIVTVGTELLLGEVVDTNATFVAGELANLGVNLYHKTTVGDNWLRLSTALGIALSRADLVIISGGLGPTQDDITKEVVAAVVGRPFVFRQDVFDDIAAYLANLGRPSSLNNRRQAMFPEGAKLIPNPTGTAPGVWLEHGDKLLICLPGVPHELQHMMEESVVPWLRQRENVVPLHSRILRFSGIGESAVEQQLLDLIEEQTSPTLALYASMGEVRLRMTCRANSEAEAADVFGPIENEIKRRLAPYLFAIGDATLEQMIGVAAREAQVTIAVAESCTGGLLGHRLTGVAGSSDYFVGGIIAYANEAKIDLLGVQADDIKTRGAVSQEVAWQMAVGARQRFGADYGVGITGIAGPGGGTEAKPVGTLYIACAYQNDVRSLYRLFKGDRELVQKRAAQEALWLLYECITGRNGGV